MATNGVKCAGLAQSNWSISSCKNLGFRWWPQT